MKAFDNKILKHESKKPEIVNVTHNISAYNCSSMERNMFESENMI